MTAFVRCVCGGCAGCDDHGADLCTRQAAAALDATGRLTVAWCARCAPHKTLPASEYGPNVSVSTKGAPCDRAAKIRAHERAEDTMILAAMEWQRLRQLYQRGGVDSDVVKRAADRLDATVERYRSTLFDAAAAELASCTGTNGEARCTLAAGHDGGHVFEPERSAAR